MGKQEDFVLRALEERDVRFVRLWFTDVLGFLKSVAVAPAELEGAFDEGIGFDGSAIEGFARVYEADMLAKPDPSTFQILPWRGDPPGTARMFCDLQLPDGTPSFADPRHVLQRALGKAADLGFTFYTHPEIEFFLLEQGRDANGRPIPVDDAGYFDHVPHGTGHDFCRAAIHGRKRQPDRLSGDDQPVVALCVESQAMRSQHGILVITLFLIEAEIDFVTRRVARAEGRELSAQCAQCEQPRLDGRSDRAHRLRR